MLRRQKPQAAALLSENDVFLSCKDEGVIKGFTSSLYHKLRSKGLKIFMDDEDLERGKITSLLEDQELFRVIQESKIVIVVLSPNYASSTWHLDRLLKILECINDTNKILPVFHDVDPSHVRKQRGKFEEIFNKYEERFWEDLAKVQRWRAGLTKVSYLVGWISKGRKQKELIKEIVEVVSSKIYHTLDLTNNAQQERKDTSEWIFLLTSLSLEISSAAFDQVSSPSKPQYALTGMLLAIAAVLTCIWELIHKGIKEGVVLRRRGKLRWFYYPHPRHDTPFGTLVDMYGLIGGISQCICSAVQYVYLHQHADSPIKLSLLPAIFLLCLASSRLNRN